MKNNKKKKKGFTLIELIAVIAILGILAAITVPNIQGYTLKAKKGKAVTDSKIVTNAIDAYNAEIDNGTGRIIDTEVVGPPATSGTVRSNANVVGPNAPIATWPSELSDALTVGQLRGIVTGTLTYGSSAGNWTINSSTGAVTIVP